MDIPRITSNIGIQQDTDASNVAPISNATEQVAAREQSQQLPPSYQIDVESYKSEFSVELYSRTGEFQRSTREDGFRPSRRSMIADDKFPNFMTKAMRHGHSFDHSQGHGHAYGHFKGIFKGLGALATLNVPQEQTVADVDYIGDDADSITVQGMSDGLYSRVTSDQFKLYVETAQGDRLSFELSRYTDEGTTDGYDYFSSSAMSLSLKINGDLNESELAAIADLGEGIEALYESLISGESPSIEALNLFSSDQLTSVSIDYGIQSQFTLTTGISDGARNLQVGYLGNKLNIDAYEANAIGEQSQSIQQASLTNYLQLIESSVEKSNGTSTQQQIMTQALTAIQQTSDNSTTGLLDFNFKFSSSVDRPNLVNGKVSEYSGFKLAFSQSTQILETDGARVVQQNQSYKLSAGYYEGRFGGGQPMFDSQSYQFFHLNESFAQEVVQQYDGNQVGTTTIAEASNTEYTHLIYDLGKLIANDVDQANSSDTKVLTEIQAIEYARSNLMYTNIS